MEIEEVLRDLQTDLAYIEADLCAEDVQVMTINDPFSFQAHMTKLQ